MDEFLVGVDGSDHSAMALRWAAGAGDAFGVPVRAVQSWIHPRSSLLPLSSLPVSPEEMDEKTMQATAEFVAGILGSSAPVTSQALRGLPAGAMLRSAMPSSVLVLGSRGLGGFKGLLLGSASQELVEYATCPVTVIRTAQALGDGDLILVGKDGSEGSQQALAWAHALGKATGASVRAVHAWRAAVSERPPGKSDRLRSRAAGAVRGWTSEVGDEIETEEVEGDPRSVLVEAAERWSAALTVVGRRGAGGLRSMRMGSTANHLVRHSSTNVAVVPLPDD